MLSLLLVAALCSNEPQVPCSYLDVTARLKVTSDSGCYATANEANRHNIQTGQSPRYNCIPAAEYLALIGEKSAVESTEQRRAM